MRVTPSAAVRYVTLNNKQGPFKDPDVRRALWSALDRTAMDDALGGPPLVRAATHFLYPGLPGFQDAEISVAPRRYAYEKHAHADLEVAARYMRHAGYPSGKYTGHHTLSVVGVKADPSSKIAGIVVEALHRLGFKTKLLLVSERDMYDKYCGVPAREIDVCPNVKVHADIPDGQAVLDRTFDGNAITPTGNENWGQVDKRNLNEALEREARVLDKVNREGSWASMDGALVYYSVAIPYAWMSGTAIESRNVDGVADVWNSGTWDLSFTSLR